MTNKNELNANERTENMKEKELRQIKIARTIPVDSNVIVLPTWSERYSKTHELRPFKKFVTKYGKKIAFTLAETLIALTILGIVAAITVPQLVRRQQEVANRTKFKKAVMSYESVMNKIAVMNDLKSNPAIQSWATKDGTISDCSVAYDYFKSVKLLSDGSKCRFKTADGVFWDITDIQRPIIALKEKDLNDDTAKSTTNRAFYLYGQYDGQGILRVTEPNFNYNLVSANADDTNSSVERLWAYLKGETSTTNEEACDNNCKIQTNKRNILNKAKDLFKNECLGSNVGNLSCRHCSTYSGNQCIANQWAAAAKIYDENGKIIGSASNCTDVFDITTCNGVTIIDETTYPNKSIEYTNCNWQTLDCTSSKITDTTIPNKTIVYKNCDGQAQNCTSSDIDDRATIANKRIYYFDCDSQAQNCARSAASTFGSTSLYFSDCDVNVKGCKRSFGIKGGWMDYYGCDGITEICTSSAVYNAATGVRYLDCNVNGNGCNYTANVNGHSTDFTGCDGMAGTCTNSTYTTSEGTYNCDGNVQSCTFTPSPTAAPTGGGDDDPGCLIRGTLITMADGTQKPIEDIGFDDELSVWDFDNGCLATAKPLWIKVPEYTNKYNLLTFSDGRTLKTINQHRIFNKEAGKYTYPMTDDTPLGTTTLLEDGSEVTLVKKEVIEQPVEYYNIVTEYHFNCFANGISTSNRFNNLYPIKDYKFVKEEREVVPYEEYSEIPYEWYVKMRLAEQPREVNRDGADHHADSITSHILKDYIAKNKRPVELPKREALV